MSGMLSLGPGAPRGEYYPFLDLESSILRSSPNSSVEPKLSSLYVGAKEGEEAQSQTKYDLVKALSYGDGTGCVELVDFMTEHVKKIHRPIYRDWQCILTGGNTLALDIALRMFHKRGSFLLTEEYTYTSALETAEPLGIHVIGIKMDNDGLIPSEMNYILEHWSPEDRGGAKPQVLYTIPTGQNPTGVTASRARREEIYAVAQKHDIYIIEDDPYYYLQLQSTSELKEPYDFQEALNHLHLPASYLSIDTDGRVLRMDSFSKIIAPGVRMSWITASEQIIERVFRTHEVSLQSPSGFSQILVYKLLSEQWGQVGFLNWITGLQVLYGERRDALVLACQEYLPDDLVSWVTPTAGFFIWLKIDHLKHPLSQQLEPSAIEDLIYVESIKERALVLRGSWFRAEPSARMEEVNFRITFASSTFEEMELAVKRFGSALKKCFGNLEQSI
ncbi:Aromatic amino acid aminotransferase [Lachnellula hyalina]|uniref:Aromatic amino acid aminotransferase n=1 Tax=Lachnellula hyalina TaxID=1316788 RepID=A0A8H8R4H6_9HELO|nr:Aromatic amino acid aminotransferase [Lachnellula hyalina]TVY28274.1 Aromatic amino acid aminotransferase [Lachnellula hyalina]